MQRLVKSSRRRTGCRQWISNGSERGVPDRTVARQTQPRTLAGGTWIAGLEAGAVAPAAKSAQRTERWAGRAADQCGAVHLPVPRSDDLHSSGSTNRTALLAAARAPTLRLPPGPRGRHKPPPATSLAGRQVSRDGHTETAGLPAVSVPLIPAPPGRGTSAKSAWPVRATSLRTSGRRRVSCTRQAAFACRVPSWRRRPGSLWGSQPA